MPHTLKILLSALTLLTLSGCNPASEMPGEGTWRVINYWAIWCTPCREEIPELNALNQLEDVTVLGVNFDGKTGAELTHHRQQLGIEFASLGLDPMAFFGTPKPQVLPTTLLVNPSGVLVATLVGPQTGKTLTAALADAGRKQQPVEFEQKNAGY